MPTTRPRASTSGPPEFPGLSAALCCTTPSIRRPWPEDDSARVAGRASVDDPTACDSTNRRTLAAGTAVGSAAAHAATADRSADRGREPAYDRVDDVERAPRARRLQPSCSAVVGEYRRVGHDHPPARHRAVAARLPPRPPDRGVVQHSAALNHRKLRRAARGRARPRVASTPHHRHCAGHRLRHPPSTAQWVLTEILHPGTRAPRLARRGARDRPLDLRLVRALGLTAARAVEVLSRESQGPGGGVGPARGT